MLAPRMSYLGGYFAYCLGQFVYLKVDDFWFLKLFQSKAHVLIVYAPPIASRSP